MGRPWKFITNRRESWRMEDSVSENGTLIQSNDCDVFVNKQSIHLSIYLFKLMLRVGEEDVGWMSSHKLHRNVIT